MKKNYPLLLWSQFLSAFGDNAILAVILGQLTLLQKAGEITSAELRTRNTVYTSLLFFPYVLLAPLAGYLNDRYSKTSWLLGGNGVKLLGTAVCGLSVWFGYVWQAPGYVIVGIGACFYGPAKYGILPEILPREKLVEANGMVELLTLVAILFGTIAGSVIIDHLPVKACYMIVLAIYGASLALNLAMTPTPKSPAVRLGSSLYEFVTHFESLLTHARLCKILLGTALFWLCGATMKINFQPWGLDVLHLTDNTQISLLGLWLSLGVMAGSLLAGALHQVGDLNRTRVYGFALAVMLVILWSIEPLPIWQAGSFLLGPVKIIPMVILMLMLTGVAAGLFLIPLNAALQAESDQTKLGKTIAAQNVTDNLAMIAAAGIALGCVKSNLSAGQVFLVLAVLVVASVACLRLPSRVSGTRPQ